MEEYDSHVELRWALTNTLEQAKDRRKALYEVYEKNPKDPSGRLDGLCVLADNDVFFAACELGMDYEDHLEDL